MTTQQSVRHSFKAAYRAAKENFNRWGDRKAPWTYYSAKSAVWEAESSHCYRLSDSTEKAVAKAATYAATCYYRKSSQVPVTSLQRKTGRLIAPT